MRFLVGMPIRTKSANLVKLEILKNCGCHLALRKAKMGSCCEQQQNFPPAAGKSNNSIIDLYV